MIRLATMNATGDQNQPPGSRYGRGRSGSCLRRQPKASGAPAYISTLAEVTNPTSFCQVGNGRKTMRSMTNAKSRPNQGTPRLVVRSKRAGTYPLRDRPQETRELAV